jgi:pimeloyl-ACP methyl ester carboxylesterase
MFALGARARKRPAPDLDALAALACPILLVVGSADDGRRVRQAHQLAELNERCRLVLVDGAHHAVHKERPSEVAAAVGEFLDSVTECARP